MTDNKLKTHMKSTVMRDVPRTLCGFRVTSNMNLVDNDESNIDEVTCNNCTRILNKVRQ